MNKKKGTNYNQLSLFSSKETVLPAAGYDFRDGMDVDKSVIGKYTTELLSLRAEQIIETHNKSQV